MARGHPDFLVTAGKTSAGDQKIDFDFLINNGTRIMKTATINNATTTIYTVPTGKKFYLLAAMVANHNATGTGGLGADLYIDATSSMIIAMKSDDSDAQNISMSFSVPMLLLVDQDIIGKCVTAGNTSQHTIIGYEVDA